MTIVYDGHIFRWQSVGGVSRYFREIVSRLPNDWSPTIIGEAGDNLPSHPNLVASKMSSVRPRRFSQPIKKRWWAKRYVSRADVFHPTYYNLSGGLQYREIKCPIVITIHDMIAARFRELEDNAEQTLSDQRAAVAAAAHAICVSRATEGDFLERNPQMAGRTSVTYHGTSFPVCTDAPSDSVFERPTFLYVGRRATYKNFGLLIRAFAKACQLHPTIRLCAAGAPLTEDERWQIHFLQISDRVESVVYPDEQSLQSLYRRSVALLYPSRHEGFGIPPLEAMACGTLAVTSNTTSLPEVVGDAGIMLDPTNESAWTDCILAIANQKVPRGELLQRGRDRATQLSWDASARSHVETYRRLA
jgi:glycosyltransferase involved in cell wall biosynthesis